MNIIRSKTLTPLFLALALLTPTGCESDKTSSTAIIVEVWSDLEIPAQMDRITIDLIGKSKQQVPYELTGVKAQALPLRFAVIPDGNQDDPFTIIATGWSGARDVVNQSARLKFLSADTRVLTLVLGRDCIGKECGDASLTCSRGRCESNERDPRSLPIESPAPPFGDGGTDADAAGSDADTADTAPLPVDVMSCAAGEDCGACGGKVLCDGSCSVSSPPNLGAVCGSCGGKVLCDGSCSVATPSNFNTDCGSCGGKVLCDGSCSVAMPSNFDTACGACGGKVRCDGSCSRAPQMSSVSLQPGPDTGIDARVQSRLPDTAAGDAPRFAALAWTWDGTPGTIRSYLKFDLSDVPADATVTKATLSLFGAASSDLSTQHSTLSGSNAAVLSRVTSAWAESTVTWATKPTVDATGSIAVPETTSPNQSVSLDVTSMVQSMKTGPNHGFEIRLATEQHYRSMSFMSSDAPDANLRPKLEVMATRCVAVP